MNTWMQDIRFALLSFAKNPGFTLAAVLSLAIGLGRTPRSSAWQTLSGPRVVISHNAPVINPNSKYKGGPLTPAFNSLDMVEIIETHQPALWVYGHTHECDDQTIGRTRIISNQLGYPGNLGGFECKDFDEAGLPVEVGV